MKIVPGITDGRKTEIISSELTADTPVIVSIKPVKTE